MPAKPQKLPASFFQRPDVLQIARDLLGKHLYTDVGGILTAGRVVETEAYRHEGDHSLTLHLQRKRQQAQGLHVPGGHAYIYTVYNRHALFNIATHDATHPDAVLIRAVEPTLGIPEMLLRRGVVGGDVEQRVAVVNGVDVGVAAGHVQALGLLALALQVQGERVVAFVPVGFGFDHAAGGNDAVDVGVEVLAEQVTGNLQHVGPLEK